MFKLASFSPFQRPADTTAYASGDLVANSTTAGSVVAPDGALTPVAGGAGRLRRCRLKKSGTGVTNAAFRVHLFRNRPTVTNGDNGAFIPSDAGYMGAFDIASMIQLGDGAAGFGAPVAGSEILFDLPDTEKRAYVLIEARGAYTPISAESFTVTLEGEYEAAPNPACR